MTNETSATGGEAFEVGSWERPDPAGVVRRGQAAGFTIYVEKYGESPACFAGSEPGEFCKRPAVLEVYGLTMCEVHGEEAASGALEEIAYDLEQELERPLNGHVRPLSSHLVRALHHGFESLPEEAGDYKRADAALLEAFPLERAKTSAEILAYAEDPDTNGCGDLEPPYDAYRRDRLLLHRHMRLAFEEGAHWLVEMLEAERAKVAAQAAYALALSRESGTVG